MQKIFDDSMKSIVLNFVVNKCWIFGMEMVVGSGNVKFVSVG